MHKSVAFTLALALGAGNLHAGQYLYAWAMQTTDPTTAVPPAESMGRDFLAVFEVGLDATEFGKLVAMLPAGKRAQMAHHTNYSMPADGFLFASDFRAGEAYVFDVRDPEKPKLSATFGQAGPYTHPHSFAALANGHTLATYQFKGEPDEQAGALVELDRAGRVVRSSDASDSAVDKFIRPYSLEVVPKLDRVVTSSADMLPSDESSHVVQVWRLSDLKLIRSVVLPKSPRFKDAVNKNATEPRLLEDGETVLVVTSSCGLYRLTGLSGDDPGVEFVHDFGYRNCAVPTVMGHYWIQTAMSGHALVSLDVRDPAHPVDAGTLALRADAVPHWIAGDPAGKRIVITGFGWLATRALFASLDPETGAMKLDSRVLDFAREWPDGWKGAAMPHGVVFGAAK